MTEKSNAAPGGNPRDSATEITEGTEEGCFIMIFEFSVHSVSSVARIFCAFLRK